MDLVSVKIDNDKLDYLLAFIVHLTEGPQEAVGLMQVAICELAKKDGIDLKSVANSVRYGIENYEARVKQ